MVSAETVEFRLPDGSAHPHLLLAGIAQAMVAARDFDDLDSLLEKTCSQTLQAPFAIPVPRTFREVADGLRQHRLAFECAGVFPRHVVDRTIEALGQMWERGGRTGIGIGIRERSGLNDDPDPDPDPRPRAPPDPSIPDPRSLIPDP